MQIYLEGQAPIPNMGMILQIKVPMRKPCCCAGSRLQLVGICESMNPQSSNLFMRLANGFVNGESIIVSRVPTVNLATNEGIVAGSVTQRQEAVTWRVIWEYE
ncbi:uncharacterized protein EAF01_000263 [Botrytis porri]|uniref:uncharacterized protein n=1 Tax=Botrytis porri TaxID=87229 RepID=UPI0018FFB8E6|nr:uncharacterized protein EAF01_000263 [Botrytis porri]KAF7913857.1 hypothetical protein EAF01_000263 [Botrytis porri]